MSKSQLSPIDAIIYPLSQQFSTAIGLPHLGPHLPTLVLSFLIFNAVQYIISPYFSPSWSTTYAAYAHAFRGKTRTPANGIKNDERKRGVKTLDGWHTHVVAFLHAVFILPLAFASLDYPALNGVRERAFGWDERIGFISAISLGYFLWDIFDSLINYESIGFVLHAVACFAVFILSYKPFLAYYGPRFLLWELSTPFLNLNWFFERTHFKGTKVHLLNGVLFLVSFAGARLVYGTYMSYNFYKTCYFNRDEIPAPLIWTYAIGNLVLNGLNWFWFSKMLSTVRRRFAGSNASTTTNGSVAIGDATEQTTARTTRSVSAKAIGQQKPRMRAVA